MIFIFDCVTLQTSHSEQHVVEWFLVCLAIITGRTYEKLCRSLKLSKLMCCVASIKCKLFLISGRAGGHRHYMFALLYLLTHWSLLNLGEIPADKTCTSLPQAWSVPRGDRIEPEPVMKCSCAQAATD